MGIQVSRGMHVTYQYSYIILITKPVKADIMVSFAVLLISVSVLSSTCCTVGNKRTSFLAWSRRALGSWSHTTLMFWFINDIDANMFFIIVTRYPRLLCRPTFWIALLTFGNSLSLEIFEVLRFLLRCHTMVTVFFSAHTYSSRTTKERNII